MRRTLAGRPSVASLTRTLPAAPVVPLGDDPLRRRARVLTRHLAALLEPEEAFVEFRADGWYTMALGDPERHRGTFAVGRVARLASPIS